MNARSTPGANSGRSQTPSSRDLYRAQVRAFAYAFEDVDADQETLADLMDGLADDLDDGESENSDSDEPSELDISALYHTHTEKRKNIPAILVELFWQLFTRPSFKYLKHSIFLSRQRVNQGRGHAHAQILEGERLASIASPNIEEC
jgi:hypothetical protein